MGPHPPPPTLPDCRVIKVGGAYTLGPTGLGAERFEAPEALFNPTLLDTHDSLPTTHRLAQVGAERFEAPEALFNPTLLDVDGKGLADLVFEVINTSDLNVRPLIAHPSSAHRPLIAHSLPSTRRRPEPLRHTRVTPPDLSGKRTRGGEPPPPKSPNKAGSPNKVARKA